MCSPGNRHANGCCCGHAHAAIHESGPLRLLFEYDANSGTLVCSDAATGETLATLDSDDRIPALPYLHDERPTDAADLLQRLLSLPADDSSDDEQDLPAPRRPRSTEDSELGAVEKVGRLKLWDLPTQFHCPVIGTCLSVEQLRRIADKAGCGSDKPLDDYKVHVSFVVAAEERNTLSLATHKALEKCYGPQVRRFSRARNGEQLAQLWREAVEGGDVPGALWALVTHPRCDKQLRRRAYEEVHMLSHQIGAGQRADLKRLSDSETELRHLKREFESLYSRTRAQIADRDQRIQDMQDELAMGAEQLHHSRQHQQQLQQQLETLQQRLADSGLDRLQRQLDEQTHRLQAAEQSAASWAHAAEQARAQQADLQQRLRHSEDECRALEGLLGRSQDSCGDCSLDDCSQCPDPDLQGRRILCVGGRNQLLNHYRSLVSRYNGIFDHHDGGQEDNRARLEAMLASADAVLCATDCVSHDAYYRLKKVCKRDNKPHVFLPTSGISSFARALETVAAQPAGAT